MAEEQQVERKRGVADMLRSEPFEAKLDEVVSFIDVLLFVH